MIDFPSAQIEREQSGRAIRAECKEAEEESLCAQMISMQGPRLWSSPQRWRSLELADDEVAQMGLSLAPRSLLCMEPAL